jgi:hypothetical protein
MNSPHIDSDPDVNWNNNGIQFPRLLAELNATGTFTDAVIHEVAGAMDLDPSQVYELIDRSVDAWDDIKERTFNLIDVQS